MSQSGGSSGRKKRTGRTGTGIELAQLVTYLRVIGSMALALLVVSILFCVIFPTTEEGVVIYIIVFAVNLIAGIGSLVGAHILDKKDKELTEKEKQARQKRR